MFFFLSLIIIIIYGFSCIMRARILRPIRDTYYAYVYFLRVCRIEKVYIYIRKIINKKKHADLDLVKFF
jgi:hypothetical protein